jgi:succinate dehydrogenase flavin-adding protein (antitoxin of CptAB toxin-antitoxin module)
MKELDVLLERYVRSRMPLGSAEERDSLARLLELPDPLLADYLFGDASAAEPALARLVSAIRGGQQSATVRAEPGTQGDDA